MNRHRLLLFVMAVVSFVLLWGPGFTSIFDDDACNAWAKHTQHLSPSTILSPGRDVGPVGLTLRLTNDPSIICRGNPNSPFTPSTAAPRLAAHDPNETRDGASRQTLVAKQPPSAENKSFEFKDGLLTLEANQRPISEILAQISTAAGVEIVVFDPVDSARISVNVKDKPLEEALRTILKGYSHSVVYNPKTESQGVRIVQQPKRDPRRNMPYAQPSLPSAGGDNQSPLVLIEPEGQGPLETASAVQGEKTAKGNQGAGTVGEQPGNEGEKSEQVASAAGGGELAQKTETPSPETSPQASPQLATLSSEGVQSQAPQGGNSNSYVTPNPVERLQKLIAMAEDRIASGASDREYEMNLELSGGGHVSHDRDRIEFWQEALNRHAGR